MKRFSDIRRDSYRIPRKFVDALLTAMPCFIEGSDFADNIDAQSCANVVSKYNNTHDIDVAMLRAWALCDHRYA